MTAVEPRHCDDYIRDRTQPLCLRRFLVWHRAPATWQWHHEHCRPALFADWQGERYRVVMASRLGDVGISRRFNEKHGYHVRVMVGELSNFAALAEGDAADAGG